MSAPRRLRILACDESFDRMRPVAGGARHCKRCSRRVHDASSLTEAELEVLVERAQTERVCLRSELVGGRPRLASGIAAGFLAVALTGCTAPTAAVQTPSEIPVSPQRVALEGEGIIRGVVRDPDHEPVANAIVVLRAAALPHALELMTNAEGLYVFTDLPPGNYTIQVLAGRASLSKITKLPRGARFQANFTIDPERDNTITLGMLDVEPTIPMDASSTSHSSAIWIE